MSKKNKKKHETNGSSGHADTTPAPASIPSGATKTGHVYTQSLPVKLDEEQLMAIRVDLTNATMARVGKEAEVAELRDEIKGLKDHEAKLVGQLEKGTEEGEVECQDYLLADQSVQTVRVDTGEVVGEPRAADAEDLQSDMFDEDDVAGTEHHDTPGEEDQELSEDRP